MRPFLVTILLWEYRKTEKKLTKQRKWWGGAGADGGPRGPVCAARRAGSSPSPPWGRCRCPPSSPGSSPGRCLPASSSWSARLIVRKILARFKYWLIHWKWRAGENPIEMSGSDLCIPWNKTAWPCYFQKRILMFCTPISTFMYLWAIYIPGIPRISLSLLLQQNRQIDTENIHITCSQTHECRNWEGGCDV